MKRKPQPPADPPPIIAPEIREGVRHALRTDKVKGAEKCTVCGSDAASGTDERLCWVCRRLKISAWRDVEQQAPAQE